MLFCSPEFVLFFSLAFLAYWALPGRRARLGLLVAAAPFFLYVMGRCVALQSPADWGQWLVHLGHTLSHPAASWGWTDKLRYYATNPPLVLPPVHSGTYYWLLYWVAGI